MSNNENLNIPPYAKIKVYWDDKPENYSREAKNKVRNYFAKKYGVNKANINIVYRPVKMDNEGNMIEITGAGIDNIMDINYQRELMKEWYKREGKTIDFDRLMKLDDKVNGEINMELEDVKHRSWELKWLKIDNFLCFGNDNFISFDRYNGLNIVTSEPQNQGGKTTFSVDAIKFLFYGRTTKTDKNEQIFNQFSKNNELIVKGMVVYDGKEVVIERKMTRSLKKDGNWAVKNSLNYYEILPDGEEDLMNDEDAIKSSVGIEKTIGSEKDFDITVLATASNLDDLIDSTPTESGKLLTKFIGLEVIENKEKASREMYSTFSKTKQTNMYNVVTLSEEISTSKDNLDLYEGLLISQTQNLSDIKEEILRLNNERDLLLESKHQIDIVISQLNPTKIESEMGLVINAGTTTKNKIGELTGQINDIGEVEYSEFEYQEFTKELNSITSKRMTISNDILRIEALLVQLEVGKFCPTCKKPLDDVDHTSEINGYKSDIIRLKNENLELGVTQEELKGKIYDINIFKEKVDTKNRLELSKEKLEMELSSLREDLKVKKSDLAKYKQNEASITHNIEVDIKITAVKTNIVVKENERDVIARKLVTIEHTIEENKNVIVKNEIIINKINQEEEVEKIFKVYIEMVGKKGISKLVLRSVLPIINSELLRLMDDVCDFEVELNINTKNEVEYLLIMDGVEKPLKSGSGFEKTVSGLALRCVLGKMSHLPMPNFITFDEVISGPVSSENINRIKPMFDKIKDMFDIVFFITHNDIVKDWADNIITIKKTDNISKIHTK